jgi:hypothetical protein
MVLALKMKVSLKLFLLKYSSKKYEEKYIATFYIIVTLACSFTKTLLSDFCNEKKILLN